MHYRYSRASCFRGVFSCASFVRSSTVCSCLLHTGFPIVVLARGYSVNAMRAVLAQGTVRGRQGHALTSTCLNIVGSPLSQCRRWQRPSCTVVGDTGVVVASRQHPCADRGLLKKELEVSSAENLSGGSSSASTAASSPLLHCGLISTLDVFAQSRITNYAKRISTSPLGKSSSSISLAKPLYNLKKLFRMDLQIPVELFYSGRLERSQITATGLAIQEKDALIAACMHAERCIDALSIPLFSAEGRQRKRVEELRQEGRWAPMPHDPPQEFSTENLPPPICFVSPHLLSEGNHNAALHNHPKGGNGDDALKKNNGQGGPCSSGATNAGEFSQKKNSSGPTRFTRLAGEKPFQHLNTSSSGHGIYNNGFSHPIRRQRSRDFSTRFGCDPFLNSFNEMQNLYQTILQHQQNPSEEEEDDDVPITIDACEVEILQPSPCERKSMSRSGVGEVGEGERGEFSSSSSSVQRPQGVHAHDTASTANSAKRDGCSSSKAGGNFHMGTPQHSFSSTSSFSHSTRPSPGSMNFIGRASTDNAPNRSYFIPSHFQCVDETEGGQFKLVDVSVDKWLPERKNPIAVCIRDSTVHERLKGYWEQQNVPSHGKALNFEDSVEVTVAEQETNVQQSGRWRTVLMKWYTASVVIPGVPLPSQGMEGDTRTGAAMPLPSSCSEGGKPSQKLVAIGKATTLEAAKDLCAMHMEELLNFFGIPISIEAETQLTHFDGCLRWGRFAAPEPIPFAKGVADPNLPCPNKEWYVPRKARLRVSPMTVTEKLQALNRRVVSQYRQHHIEVDLMHFRQYDSVMTASPVCLRDFMRSQQHPFECAIMNFHLAPNEYRSSVYLPLPAEYGVRGGCAVGRTEEVAYHLCALNAMDVLFALDCVPTPLLERSHWQDYLKERARLGMILPYSYRMTLSQSSSSTRGEGDGQERNPLLLKPPTPSLRSPPGVRDAPNSWSSEMPPPEEIWKVLMTNAEDFDVAPDPAHLPALQGLEVVNLLRRLFSRFLRSCSFGNGLGSMTTVMGGASAAPTLSSNISHSRGGSGGTLLDHQQGKQKIRLSTPSTTPAGPLKCLRHYCGYQHQNGIRRVRANNCWMELPLDKSMYGLRIAYGRCLTRNGAERAFFIHAFRILRALHVAPWEEYQESDLSQRLYGGDDSTMRKELEFWRLLVKHALDPSLSLISEGEELGSQSNGESGRSVRKKHQVPSAELISSTPNGGESKASRPVADISTPSPNPVMTPQLASLTLL